MDDISDIRWGPWSGPSCLTASASRGDVQELCVRRADPPRGYTAGHPTPHGQADGTPPAARRQRPHLPRVLRAHRPAADDVEGRAGHGGVRLHEHRPARDPGCEARPHRRRLRSRQAHVPARALRRVQGHPHEDARRHAGADPEGPGRRRGPRLPGLRARGVRGGRRHRHARGAGESRGTWTSPSSPATSTCSSWSARTRG